MSKRVSIQVVISDSETGDETFTLGAPIRAESFTPSVAQVLAESAVKLVHFELTKDA